MLKFVIIRCGRADCRSGCQQSGERKDGIMDTAGLDMDNGVLGQVCCTDGVRVHAGMDMHASSRVIFYIFFMVFGKLQ